MDDDHELMNDNRTECPDVDAILIPTHFPELKPDATIDDVVAALLASRDRRDRTDFEIYVIELDDNRLALKLWEKCARDRAVAATPADRAEATRMWVEAGDRAGIKRSRLYGWPRKRMPRRK